MAFAGPNTPRQLPAIGFPIPVREDGTISLPLIPPLRVAGMSVEEAEEAVRKAYTGGGPDGKEIIKPGREKVIVALSRPRDYHILVIRQDAAQQTAGTGTGTTGARASGFIINFGGGARGTRRGQGFALDLTAYENDVLNALARTGGFPGSDAANEIIVERGSFAGAQGRQHAVDNLLACPPGADPLSAAVPGTQRIRIPLRYRPGHPPPIRPEDVILQTGDIVFIEALESDVFYAGGLLPSGEYPLPRDTDLNVVQAIARIGGTLLGSGINTANINGQEINPGLSLPYPTLCSVVRETPGGGQVVIRVDLDRALRDPRERILLQPRDMVFVQERPDESIGRYLSETFNFNLRYTFVNSRRALGVTTNNLPQPLTNLP
jgi:protein involved in polysaccharide export with SLBB domain